MIAVMLCIAANFASAEPYLTIDQHVSPSEIWSVGSGVLPNQAQVTLTVKGEGEPQELPVEMILAIDSSGDMNGSDPNQGRLLTAESVIMAMNDSKDRVGVVGFDDDVDFVQPLTDDLSSAINKTREVDSEGGASLDAGLNASINLLIENDTESGAAKIILLISDGNGSYTPSGESGSLADRAIEEGIVIYAIGLNLNDSVAEERLMNMTSATCGRYYKTVENDTVESIYQEISTTEVAGEDVVLIYSLPTGLSASGYSIEPESIKIDPDVTVLAWDLGTILTEESDNVSFNISTPGAGVFCIGGAAKYLNYDGITNILDLEIKQIEVQDFRSGISARFNVIPDGFTSQLDTLVERYRNRSATFNYAERYEDHVALVFWETGDTAFVFDDGRLVIASADEFDLDKRDEFDEQFWIILDVLGGVGVSISTLDLDGMLNNAVYYTQEANVYHDTVISFSDDFCGSLVIPNSTIEDANLRILGDDAIGTFGITGICVEIDYDSPWDRQKKDCCYGKPRSSCSVNPASDDVCNQLLIPGTHTMCVTQVDDRHSMLIEFITSPCESMLELRDAPSEEVIKNEVEITRRERSSDVNALADIIRS